MINSTLVPKELIGSTTNSFEPKAEKYTLEGIDEIQQLCVSPWTSIKKHGHNDQWEVWVRLSRKIAYICLKGEEHELINNSNDEMCLMAIKGHIDYSYDDLAQLFHKWGFLVKHGSLIE